MRVAAINGPGKVQNIASYKSDDSLSIDRKADRLKKQLEQVRKNKQLSFEEKEKMTDNLQRQIENLQRQKSKLSEGERGQDISSDGIEKTENTVKAEAEKKDVSKELPYEMKGNFDTFEHQVKPRPLGVYELSFDEEGNRTIKFENPDEDDVHKSKDSDSEKFQIVKTTINTDAVDNEIEKLKETLEKIKQRLSSNISPEEEDMLKKEADRLEAEIKQKDSDSYYRQRGIITEQKVVSQIGQ